MNPKLSASIKESLAAVLPITGIVLALSITVLSLNVGTAMLFLVGAVLLIVGMGMFQLGSEMAMSPLGEGIGVLFSGRGKKVFVLSLSFLIGILITVAEPDLQVLSDQVPSVPNRVLIFAVSFGVGTFLMIAVLRILRGWNLARILLLSYALLLVVSLFVPTDFLAVAFDSGGVTTGPITVPFIMAFGVGLSMKRQDAGAESDSFGLVALSSVGPILAVLILGCFYRPDEAAVTRVSIPAVYTTRDVARIFILELPFYAKEVLLSIAPLVALFGLFQLLSKRFKHRQILRILVGFGYTYIGLVFFLTGVNTGFAPVGSLIGENLATSHSWLLIPIGMLIGYFIVKAEPAIRVLNRQVQTVTDGLISESSMYNSLSLGVAFSVGLSMLKILLHIPIWYILLPGYAIALILSRLVPSIFVGIAFDSGGVASGPMTSTFLLPLCIGACTILGGDLMVDAFGAVALVALTPLIAIQIMGLMYQMKLRRKQRLVTPLPADSDRIIDLEVESNA